MRECGQRDLGAAVMTMPEIRRGPTRPCTLPSTQTLLLGRLLGPVGVYGGHRPARGRDGRACTSSMANTPPLVAWGGSGLAPETPPQRLPAVRAVGRGPSRSELRVGVRVLCETGRASTSDGLLARLFPSQATDDDAIVEAPAALDRDAFRHVLSFWPPLPHLLGAPPKSSEASYQQQG